MSLILVLDDRAVERDLLEVVLRSAGHRVLQAANGEDAIELARAEHPDLVVADVLMPGMDGYEFVRKLREHPSTTSTRVILCTATYDQDEVQRLALACGVSQILIKPVEPEEILRVVAATLDTEPASLPLETVELFERQHLRMTNAKLIEKVAELEKAGADRRLLAAIVESSDDAIIASDLDGIIVSWNRGAKDLYGYGMCEALGRPIRMLVPPDRADEMPAILQQIKGGAVADPVETKRARSDGRIIDVALTISPVYGEAGTLTGVATIARDISVRKQTEEALALAHRAAVESSRAKSDFVANMSHEIRTPLNGVIGMTTLLRDTELDRLQDQYLDALAVSSEALLMVVNDVLDFSKLEAGRLQIIPSAFDCRSLFDEALLMIAGPARAKGLEIRRHVDGAVPTRVWGDRTRLRQVLLNLLSNAVKFTASGEVELRVCMREHNQIRFEVADTGIGIDASQAHSLFDAFSQADHSATREYGGTGLGLAISRELAFKMGGDIGSESREQGGSVFWFTAELPPVATAENAVTAQAAAHPERPKPPWASGLRVLLAEDNEINRTVAEAFLSKAGLETEIAQNGLEAVEMAGSRHYDAILMDCQMPELDGYEATQRIRDLEQDRHTPIIAMTAHAMAGDRERCLAAGMDDYLAKPVRVEALDRIMHHWLPVPDPDAPPNAPHETAVDSATAVAGDTQDLDRAAIAQLCDTLTSEMRATLLDTFEDSVRKGLAELAHAIEHDDRAELRRLAHRLKGSSATVGAARVSLACQQLEQLPEQAQMSDAKAQLDGLFAIFEQGCPALRSALVNDGA